MNVKRKNDPESVRLALLKSAAKLAEINGISSVTLSATAENAGVSKGALHYHFKNKDILLSEMSHYLLNKLDQDIKEQILSDPLGYGKFTRAYIHVVLSSAESEKQIWSALFSVMNDDSLNVHWTNWYETQMGLYADTDSDIHLEVIRLAVCGMCLAIANCEYKNESIAAVKEQMLRMTITNQSKTKDVL